MSISIKSFRVLIIPRIRAVPPNGPVHSECRGKIMLVHAALASQNVWKILGAGWNPHYLPNFYLLTDCCKKLKSFKIKHKNHVQCIVFSL